MTFEGGGAEKRSCFFSQKIESSKKIFSKSKRTTKQRQGPRMEADESLLTTYTVSLIYNTHHIRL
jgi:hypothetical protein